MCTKFFGFEFGTCPSIDIIQEIIVLYGSLQHSMHWHFYCPKLCGSQTTIEYKAFTYLWISSQQWKPCAV